MISLFRYINTKRRLKEIKKTIDAMGGDDAPPTLHAQYDMTYYETKYHKNSIISEFVITFIFIVVFILALDFYYKLG